MNRRCCGDGTFSNFIILLLTLAQWRVAQARLPGERTASSMLDGLSRTVPDYITRFAPLVWLHSEDPFKPADLLKHVQHTTPMVDGSPIAGLPELNLDNLAILNGVGDETIALTSNDDITALPTWLFGDAPDALGRIYNAMPCVVILVEKTSSDVDAFYFYFYSYNMGPNLTQVLEPLNRLIQDTDHKVHFGDHVGDWEHNMVRFRNGKPTGIYYSQHSDGTAYQWEDAMLSIENERPIVFSAYGSHANYPSSGDHVHDAAIIDYCDAGLRWDPVFSAYFYHLDPANLILTRMWTKEPPSQDPSNLTSFLYFDGIWGDTQYPDGHPSQKTVPYFGLKRFVSGPTGPLTKQLVRQGLFPDYRGSRSWLQWGVGLFMFFYPCCLRGWRFWLSGTVVLGTVVLIVLAIRLGVGRYRRRGYKRLGLDIPLNDLNGQDEGLLNNPEPERS